MNDPIVQSDNEIKSYLGIDFSTQQVKAIVIDNKLKVLYEASVQFDNDLPEYRTHGGVNFHEESLVVTAPVMMWVKALDMVMDKLRVAGADFSTIAAVSGTGQQHGSIYWRKGALKSLKNTKCNAFLHEQLSSSFVIPDCPVWMDSSTSAYCRRLEEKIGSAQKLAEITGSRAYERFTGNQIAKFYTTRKDAYINTERISLVSSLGCSLFLGDYAPIDYADGSGMNLLNLSTKAWSQICLDACAPDLEERLGHCVPSNSKVGTISKYFIDRYDFNPECSVVAFTGDNPASLAGMCLSKGDIAISLGTSDTLFLWLDKPLPTLEGHIFINPVDSDAYMALLCFKNGSLTRERVRDQCADGSWDIFSELLNMTPRGNFGNIGMYYYNREITPDLEGVFRFNKAGAAIDRFTSGEVEVRALVEGQFIAKRVYAQKLGLKTKDIKRVLATGGASANSGILQVLSDVFNSPVYTMKVKNSACLGAAYMAKHALFPGTFSETIQGPPFSLICSPNRDAAQVYDPMVARFEKLGTELQSNYKK